MRKNPKSSLRQRGPRGLGLDRAQAARAQPSQRAKQHQKADESNNHRSHFGSRYTSGCCDTAGLIAFYLFFFLVPHNKKARQPNQETKTPLGTPTRAITTVAILAQGTHRAVATSQALLPCTLLRDGLLAFSLCHSKPRDEKKQPTQNHRPKRQTRGGVAVLRCKAQHPSMSHFSTSKRFMTRRSSCGDKIT